MLWPAALSLSRPIPTSTLRRRKTEAALPLSQRGTALRQRYSSPSPWRLNMNTHMNIWITEQVVFVIHLHALCRACKVFCLGAGSSAEHGLFDRTSEVGQRGVGTQVLPSGSFTEKEWPVSANAPSVCLQSFLLCPCALVPRWLPCWHKDLPFAQMVDSGGPLHHPLNPLIHTYTHTHIHFLCQGSAAPLSVSETQLRPACLNGKKKKKKEWSRETGPRQQRRTDTWKHLTLLLPF